MDLKSTLVVFNEADVESRPGIVKGQSVRQLVGNPQQPTEKIWVILASFKSGTLEKLHWHLIEAFYYVMSGRAIMRDIEGKTYNIGPGSVIYAPPGVAASHEWDIKEELRLVAVRATTDLEKNIQFDVDPSTGQSTIGYEYLMSRGGAKFKSLY